VVAQLPELQDCGASRFCGCFGAYAAVVYLRTENEKMRMDHHTGDGEDEAPLKQVITSLGAVCGIAPH